MAKKNTPLTEEEQRIARNKMVINDSTDSDVESRPAATGQDFTDSDVEGVNAPAQQRPNTGEQLARVDVGNVFSGRARVQNPVSTATADIIPTPNPKPWTYAEMLQMAKGNLATERERAYNTAMMQARGRVLQNIFKPVAWGASAFANGNGPVTLATSDVNDNGTKQGYIDAFKRAQSFSDRMADIDRESRAYGLNRENYERQIQARKDLEESRMNAQREMLNIKNAFELARQKAAIEDKKALMDYEAAIQEGLIKAKSVADLEKIAADAEAKARVKGIASVQTYGVNLESYISAMKGLGMTADEMKPIIQTVIEGNTKGGSGKKNGGGTTASVTAAPAETFTANGAGNTTSPGAGVLAPDAPAGSATSSVDPAKKWEKNKVKK